MYIDHRPFVSITRLVSQTIYLILMYIDKKDIQFRCLDYFRKLILYVVCFQAKSREILVDHWSTDHVSY